jgi:ribosomal protein S18 acetylase RimI-like enzyme
MIAWRLAMLSWSMRPDESEAPHSLMGNGGVEIDRVTTRSGFEEFARLPYAVYANAEAWWPPDVHNEIELLTGRTALAAFLDIEPMVARRGGRVVARVSAVVNHRYNQHWHEKLGHLVHFESMAEEEDAATALIDAAVDTLDARAMNAVRSGFAAFLDYPYAIDNYGHLPSFLLRGNPPHYHRCFKNAGFITEKGQLDYTAPLTPEILARYRRAVEGARAAGVEIKSWREYGFLAAVDSWTDVTNAAFQRHWGWNPITREEVRPMLASLWETPVADLSMVAALAGEVVGAVFSVHDLSPMLAQIRRGVRLSPERGGGTRGALINIGVLERARGRGIALAMAARSFQVMAERGMRYAGYTLVLDDNWASRRTAEALGAQVTGNFLTYRRELGAAGRK